MSRMDNFLLVCCVLCVLSFPAQAFDHTLEFNIGNNLLTQIPDNYFPELSFKQLPQTAPDMILEHIRLQGERAFFYHRNLRFTLEEQNEYQSKINKLKSLFLNQLNKRSFHAWKTYLEMVPTLTYTKEYWGQEILFEITSIAYNNYFDAIRTTQNSYVHWLNKNSNYADYTNDFSQVLKALESLEPILHQFTILFEVSQQINRFHSAYLVIKDQTINNVAVIKTLIRDINYALHVRLTIPLNANPDSFTVLHDFSFDRPHSCNIHFSKKIAGTRLYIFRYVKFLIHCPDGHKAIKKAAEAINKETKNLLLNQIDESKHPAYYHAVKNNQTLDKNHPFYAISKSNAEYDINIDPNKIVDILTEGGKAFLKEFFGRPFYEAKESIESWDPLFDFRNVDIISMLLVGVSGMAVTYLATTKSKLIRDLLQSTTVRVKFNLKILSSVLEFLNLYVPEEELKKLFIKFRIRGIDVQALDQSEVDLTLGYKLSRHSRFELSFSHGQDKENPVNELEKRKIAEFAFSIVF